MKKNIIIVLLALVSIVSLVYAFVQKTAAKVAQKEAVRQAEYALRNEQVAREMSARMSVEAKKQTTRIQELQARLDEAIMGKRKK